MKKSWIAGAVSVLLCACTTTGSVTNAQGPQGEGLSNNLMAAVAWKQTAAEYKALYYQAFNLAQDRIDAAVQAQKPGDKPLAIISDIDDTILNAANYWGYMVAQNQDFFDDPIWDRWIPTNNIKAAPGAVALMNYAKSKGVEVFYVSSRDQGEKTFEYALENLRVNGFPYVDEAHVTILKDTSNKAPRQQEIAQRYTVVAYLGDNLNDFQRKYYVKSVEERERLMEEDKAQFGRRFILLPNPTDGHWMRAIFGDSEPPASDDNRRTFKKAATRSAWQP